jgi:four helix bundle protein
MNETRPAIRTYRDLVAWQVGMEAAEMVYRVTGTLPRNEEFGLVSQMRRAAVSVAANIAEGFGRAHKVEFRRFLEISRGSLFELQTHAELARRLGWLEGKPLKELRAVLRRLDALLAGLMASVRRREA